MSCSLDSLKKVIQGIIYRTIIGVTKGYTRSSDYGSCRVIPGNIFCTPSFSPDLLRQRGFLFTAHLDADLL